MTDFKKNHSHLNLSYYRSTYRGANGHFEAERRIAIARKGEKKALSLHGMALLKLPESLRSLKHLTWLDISDNKLTEIPEWFGELSNLTRLSICYNNLKSLPVSFGNLVHLEILEMSCLNKNALWRKVQLSPIPANPVRLKKPTTRNGQPKEFKMVGS